MKSVLKPALFVAALSSILCAAGPTYSGKIADATDGFADAPAVDNRANVTPQNAQQVAPQTPQDVQQLPPQEPQMQQPSNHHFSSNEDEYKMPPIVPEGVDPLKAYYDTLSDDEKMSPEDYERPKNPMTKEEFERNERNTIYLSDGETLTPELLSKKMAEKGRTGSNGQNNQAAQVPQNTTQQLPAAGQEAPAATEQQAAPQQPINERPRFNKKGN